MIDQLPEIDKVLTQLNELYQVNQPTNPETGFGASQPEIPLVQAYRDHSQAVTAILNFPENNYSDPLAVGLEYVRTLINLGNEGVQLVFPKDDQHINPQPSEEEFKQLLHQVYDQPNITTLGSFLQQESHRIAPFANSFTHVDGQVMPAFKKEFEFRQKVSQKLAEVGNKINPGAVPKIRPLIQSD